MLNKAAAILLVLLCLGVACAHAPITTSYLYVQTAEFAQLKLAPDPNEFILTLKHVSPLTLYFSDRPERIAGQMKTVNFIKKWNQGPKSFEDMPPNAALDYVDADRSNQVLFVELRNPKILSNGDLQYHSKLIPGNPERLSFAKNGQSLVDGVSLLPQSVKSVALFVDDERDQGLCNDKDIAAGINPDNHKFAFVSEACGNQALGGVEGTTECIRKSYPALSYGCANCYGQMAHCGARECWADCMFDHKSGDCMACVREKCRDGRAKEGFNIAKCTGLAVNQLPPPAH